VQYTKSKKKSKEILRNSIDFLYEKSMFPTQHSEFIKISTFSLDNKGMNH